MKRLLILVVVMTGCSTKKPVKIITPTLVLPPGPECTYDGYYSETVPCYYKQDNAT